MRRQSRYANEQLQALPERAAILQRLAEVSPHWLEVTQVNVRGNRTFYRRRGTCQGEPNLVVRDGPGGTERLLHDNRDYGCARLWDWSPSYDGRFVAYVTDGVLRVIDADTGEHLDDHIDGMYDNAGQWLPDSSGLLYTRELAGDANHLNTRVYLHRLGQDPASDVAVIGFEVPPDVPGRPDLVWRVGANPHWGVALASMDNGVLDATAYWTAPVAALGKGKVPWRPIIAMEDEVFTVTIHDGMLYALTAKGAGRHRIVRTPLAAPDLAHAVEVVPESDVVVTDVMARADALYVRVMDAAGHRLLRVDYETFQRTPLPMPFPGSARFLAQDPGAAGIDFSVESWNRSPQHYHYDPVKGVVATGLMPPFKVPLDEVAFENALATSADGTTVPLVILYRKGLVRDGHAPTIVEGYGAYRLEGTSPRMATYLLPWLERGGVFVRAGVRGGGERGEAWHRAGMRENKPNTWKDAIAVAEYLIAEGWTDKDHLAIQGGSAGGIMVINAITERPDLFRAALISRGETNSLRAELTGSGPPNVLEYGSVQDEAGFRMLEAMDGYHKVRAGTPYPAVLLDTGIRDRTIDAWMPAKAAARLQAATSSGRPIWLRVDDGGHETRSPELRADQYAFVLAQMRDPAPAR
jgi:prolyl oligopeptidase